MSHLYYRKSEALESFRSDGWESFVLKEFESMLTSKARPFPCIFGVAGFQRDEIRYAFSEDMSASDIAPALEKFVENSRDYGRNTSLVVFSKPGSVKDVVHYENRFWSLLHELTKLDKKERPENIPSEIDEPLREFCFAGEPIFVVCNTPAHVLRQSRRSSSFMATFQPRRVFEDILGTPEVARQSSGKVRARLKSFDLLSPSPHLGLYGDPNTREYAQYFLRENNDEEVKCPFHRLRSRKNRKKADVRIRASSINLDNLSDVIDACLPEQGAIEVQRDQSGKEHAWHTHRTDETIIVLGGALKFCWSGGEAICRTGDVIELPVGVKHGSIALDGGAKYLIVFERVALP